MRESFWWSSCLGFAKLILIGLQKNGAVLQIWFFEQTNAILSLICTVVQRTPVKINVLLDQKLCKEIIFDKVDWSMMIPP